MNAIKYIGMDVHLATISIAVQQLRNPRTGKRWISALGLSDG